MVLWTVQTRRLPYLVFKSDEQLILKERGSFDEWEAKLSKDITVTAVKWYDTSSVCLSSTFITSYPVNMCERRDRKSRESTGVPIPNIVRMCDHHMGGLTQKGKSVKKKGRETFS